MVSRSNHLLAGASSGLVSAVVLQPFDLLKTRLQQIDGRNVAAFRVNRITALVQDIIHKSGWQGLWRGTNATLIRNVPGVAVYFYALQTLRGALTRYPYFAAPATNLRSSATTVLPKLSRRGDLSAGAIARVGVGFVLNPFTVVKARFESDLYSYRTMREAFVGIVRQSGPRGLLSGFVPSALRDAPYAGIFLLFYELVKDKTEMVLARTNPNPSPALIHSVSGATAAAIASSITHPFDVVKTKMQLRPEKYHSLGTTIVTVLKDRSLFNGLSLRMSRKVLSSAITWTVYEGVLLLLRDRSKL